jgi:hypothetical protein
MHAKKKVRMINGTGQSLLGRISATDLTLLGVGALEPNIALHSFLFLQTEEEHKVLSGTY